MKLFVAATFALLALASADVSHLSRTYLPPSQQSFSGSNYHQSSFSSGSVGGGFSSGSLGGGFSAPSNEYLPPVQHSVSSSHGSSFSGPVQSFSAPAGHSYSSSVSYSAPAVHHSSFSGNVGGGFSSHGSVGGGFSSGSVGGGFSAPANEYLPPVQHSFSGPATSHSVSFSGPAVQSFSGPAAHSFSSGPSVGFSSGSVDVGTQYAANGGYVYKK